MSSVGWCCLVSSFLLGGVVVFPSPVWWCCLPSPPFGGTASSPVFCWVVLFGFILPFGWCCCFFLLLLGGAAWSPPSLALFSSPFTCFLLGFFPLWVVSPVWRCCLPSPPVGSGAFPPSSVGWCCLVSSSSFWWCCCFSFSYWVVPLGLLLPYNAKEGGEGRQHHAKGEGTQHHSKREETRQHHGKR